MVIDTSKKTEIHNSFGKILPGLLLIVCADVALFFLLCVKLGEGQLISTNGIMASILMLFFLGLTALCFNTITTFNDTPRIELSPRGIIYGPRRIFVPWRTITRLRVRSIGRFRSKFIVLDVSEPALLNNLSAFKRVLRKPSKALGLGDLDIALDACMIPPTQVEQLIRTYAKAHNSPAAEDWD